MTINIRLPLCALALMVSGALPLLATEPVPAPKVGRVLVLENARILEGDIEHIGDQYRVRRTIGETWLPGDKVQCLCANLDEAYGFLRKQANLRDPDEHLRLAKWCQLHGLRAQALTEAAEAVELRPNHVEGRRFLSGLQRSDANVPAAPKPHEDPEPDTGPSAALDFNADSLGMFVTRVQPVLMNACANCHAGGKGGAFKLMRTYEDQLTNRRATQQNLAAVLSHVNRERPQSSLLLTRAVTVHGEVDQPPLKGRQAPAYRILEDWVQLALAHVPPSERAVLGSSSPPAESKSVSEPAPAKAAPPLPAFPAAPSAAPAAAPSPPPAAVPTPAPQAKEAPPAPAAGPADPFDPMIFNQQMQTTKP